MPELPYVHGYEERERDRLFAQSRALRDLLFPGLAYPSGSRVLEVGCATGAQTVLLAERSPGAHIVAIDRSAESLREARGRLDDARVANVELREADLFALPFPAGSFDHVFVCFVLEHLADPLAALQLLRAQLAPRGTITVFEGDHGSTLLHPDSAAAREVIEAQATLQQSTGGNARIGRELFPLLRRAGFQAVRVEPRVVYVDASVPHLVDEFIGGTYTAMIEGVRDAAIEACLIDAQSFDEGIRGLRRTQADDGVFCYTFFKGVARA